MHFHCQKHFFIQNLLKIWIAIFRTVKNSNNNKKTDYKELKIGVTNRRTLNKNRLVAPCVSVLFIEVTKNEQKCKCNNLVGIFNQNHLANFIFANMISISSWNWEIRKRTPPQRPIRYTWVKVRSNQFSQKIICQGFWY